MLWQHQGRLTIVAGTLTPSGGAAVYRSGIGAENTTATHRSGIGAEETAATHRSGIDAEDSDSGYSTPNTLEALGNVMNRKRRSNRLEQRRLGGHSRRTHWLKQFIFTRHWRREQFTDCNHPLDHWQ